MENKNNNLSISIINPGKTNTKMRKQAMPGENINNLQKPKEVAEKIKDIIFSNKIYKGEVIDLIKFKLNTYKRCVFCVCGFRLYIVFMLYIVNIKNWFLWCFLSVLPSRNRFIEEWS